MIFNSQPKGAVNSPLMVTSLVALKVTDSHAFNEIADVPFPMVIFLLTP
jgi:hypothetical protein